MRAARAFDHVVVAALNHDTKRPLFSVEERLDMLRQATAEIDNVSVDSFGGLLVDYARSRGAQLILRGIRAVSDYEYELQMALMNRQLNPQLETIFLPADEKYSYLSSRLVKEVARLGGDISSLVPADVAKRLAAKRSNL